MRKKLLQGIKAFLGCCCLMTGISCQQNPGIHTVDAAAFKQIIANSDSVQLIDVRTPEEYQNGHITDAILMDVKADSFTASAEDKLNKDIPVAVYCRSGKRSLHAANLLTTLGFKQIYNLKGGITEWKEKGMEVATEP